MKLYQLNGLQKATSSYSTTPSMSLGKTLSLSREEESMIQKTFPSASNDKLALYFANGSERIEQPHSKGNHFDFRI